MKMGTTFPTMTAQAKPIRKPCGNCEKIRSHLPAAIRARLAAVEARMRSGKR